MDMAVGKCYYLVVLVFCIITINAVPPDVCFENFRFDDCGQPPQPVMYYWKPGSRCEVGMWRGCLPNPNMFHDEYECINTCIFVARAQPEDYHSHLKHDEYPEDTTTPAEVTDYGSFTDDGNATESSANGTSSGNETTLSTPSHSSVDGNITTNSEHEISSVDNTPLSTVEPAENNMTTSH